METSQFILSLLLLASVGNSLFGQPIDYSVDEREYDACVSKIKGAHCSFEKYGQSISGECLSYTGAYTLEQTGKRVTNPLICIPMYTGS